MFVLGTGRERALRLVAERTGELRHQALHDALTGLPNRALIMDRIEQLLVRNRRNGTIGAALFIDLDDFKNVNDTLGHEAGDRLLVAVAARLTSTLRDADTIGRMGGDEFVVLIDGAALDVAPELVAERLLDVMRQPFELDGASMPLIVNTSIGIAIGDRATGGDLLRDADVALYQAKARGQEPLRGLLPGDADRDQSPHRARVRPPLGARRRPVPPRLPADLQPRRPHASSASRRCCGGTTRRWASIEPDEFIPILEQTGQIREVGRWVLQRGLRADGRLARAGRHPRHLRQRLRPPTRQRRHHRRTSATPSTSAASTGTSLIIEVTETALMRNAGRHGPAAPGDQGPRRQDRRRRLRHRLLVARLPPAVPGRLPQDRPRVHQRDHARRPSPRPSSAPSSSSARTSA